MAMIAMALPILPGKKEKWKETILNHMVGQNKKNTDSIRENAGVHERSFLQESPDGDFVILTFEGDDPVAGWGEIMANLPEEFAAAAKDLHGMDVNAPPPPMPTLVYDSKSE
jgi:hypothetical protein